jgi:predicted phage baseplate assembly protein
MVLPVPKLDDRGFQDLVNDAKRLVQQRCPEWSDHNVSDPGVTLIELFAWMTDQLIYRVNRVPDRLYVKFLELMDVQLFPPAAARTGVTFWLTGPLPEPVTIHAGTNVATVRTETDDAIGFATDEDLAIVPSSLATIGSMIDGERLRSHDEALQKEAGFFCFDKVPKVDDALYVGLPEPIPSCAVTLRFRCKIEGVGVDPRNPPVAWEASDGIGWVPAELQLDETGGFNRNGDVILHVPRSHATMAVRGKKAAWLRVKVTPPKVKPPAAGAAPNEKPPTYGASPQIIGLTVFTVGGTAEASNVDFVDDEDLGTSEGVPGQRFLLARRPLVLGAEPPVLEVVDDKGTHEWEWVDNFAESGKDDRHFRIDLVSGEVQLGPAVRQSDGTMRYYGAVPEKGARLHMRRYRTGGGTIGNVAAGAISVLKSSIPFVATVENRRAARGGVDGEDVENAKIRGPIRLRSRGRAVTAEDYEYLAREAAPEVARVRALTPEQGPEAGSVRLLVVPAVARDPEARLALDQMTPADRTLVAIKKRLDETRVIGTRVLIETPLYQGINVAATLRARPRTNPETLQEEALDALYAYFDPIVGGPDGTGWPFGRPVNLGEIYSILQGLRGTEYIEEAHLCSVDLATGQRDPETTRIDIEENSLILSFDHAIEVVKP